MSTDKVRENNLEKLKFHGFGVEEITKGKNKEIYIDIYASNGFFLAQYEGHKELAKFVEKLS